MKWVLMVWLLFTPQDNAERWLDGVRYYPAWYELKPVSQHQSFFECGRHKRDYIENHHWGYKTPIAVCKKVE